MKVAYILTNYPVLYNSFITNEMLRVAERSVDVLGFALRSSNHKNFNENSLKLKDNVYYFYDFLPGLNPSAGKIASKCGKIIKNYISDSLYNIIGKIIFGNSSSELDIEKYLHLHGWNIYAYENIARYITKNNIDIIHAGFGNRPATAAMILSELTGIPFTFEAHAYDLFVDFPFQREKTQQASKIFTISNYNKEYLINKYGCESSKISVMRVPINNTFCDDIDVGPRRKKQLISVCRLHPIKGLSVAIEAVAMLAKEISDIQYIIIGDGAIKSDLQALCKKLNVSENVKFHGTAVNEVVLKTIAESAIFLLPSVIAENGDRDGIPTSLIEAMYLKTPVISSCVSGIPELIEDGLDGYLIEPGNAHELFMRIKQLIEDEELRTKMGSRGKDKVCNEFYVEDCEDVLIKGWNEIQYNRV